VEQIAKMRLAKWLVVSDFDSPFPRMSVAADEPLAGHAGAALDEPQGDRAMRHAWFVLDELASLQREAAGPAPMASNRWAWKKWINSASLIAAPLLRTEILRIVTHHSSVPGAEFTTIGEL
jgi:hypothetical protein